MHFIFGDLMFFFFFLCIEYVTIYQKDTHLQTKSKLSFSLTLHSLIYSVSIHENNTLHKSVVV